MLEFALRSEIMHAIDCFDTQRSDLPFLERQTCALEAIAAQLRVVPAQMLSSEAQAQYNLAKRRLLDEEI